LRGQLINLGLTWKNQLSHESLHNFLVRIRKANQDAINELTNSAKTAGTENIACETCEYTLLGEQTSTRICYWKTMYQYPSTVKRDIILETTIELGKNMNHPLFCKKTTRAILFEKKYKTG